MPGFLYQDSFIGWAFQVAEVKNSANAGDRETPVGSRGGEDPVE